MTNRTRLALLSAAFLLAGSASGPSTAAPSPKVIRWLVAHDRGNTPFAALNRQFAKRLEEKSGGSLKIEFVNTGASESALDSNAYKQLGDGAVDMSQLAASAVQVNVFDMPFLFEDYAKAEAVFSSPVGRNLVESIGVKSEAKVRGLAFTYSGGYRILLGNVALRNLSDFKGAKVRKSTSHIALFLNELGAVLTETPKEFKEKPAMAVAAGKIDLEETEINRISQVEADSPGMIAKIKYFNLTRHRMYITAIVANEKFFKGLSAEQQSVLTREIQNLAVEERKFSIDLEKKNLALLAEKGAKLVEFSPSDRQAFTEAGLRFESRYDDLHRTAQEIRAVQLAHR